MTSQHECIDCAALPVDDRPPRPRPATYGGPRSRRCFRHHHAFVKARKVRTAIKRVTKVYGISEQEQAELWTFQGERCPCGRKPTRRPDTDHDHACCAGPTSCGQCVRGMCCRACNKDVLGRYNAEQLEALAAYLRNPPMARMRAARRRAA